MYTKFNLNCKYVLHTETRCKIISSITKKVFYLMISESLEMLRGRQKLQEQSDLENPSEGTSSKLQQHLERSQFNFFFKSDI